MNKSPEAFRTISEVAEALDVPPHVLRFWETRFTQVKPVKRGGGRRYYRPEDVRLLRGIRGLLYDDGMTIKGVQKILRERGIRHVIGLGTLPGFSDDDVTGGDAAPLEVPAEAVLAPAPSFPTSAARPAAARGPEPHAAPPTDLFNREVAEGGAVVVERPAAAEPAAADAAPEPVAASAAEVPSTPAERRQALRALVVKLKALRKIMAEEA